MNFSLHKKLKLIHAIMQYSRLANDYFRNSRKPSCTAERRIRASHRTFQFSETLPLDTDFAHALSATLPIIAHARLINATLTDANALSSLQWTVCLLCEIASDDGVYSKAKEAFS